MDRRGPEEKSTDLYKLNLLSNSKLVKPILCQREHLSSEIRGISVPCPCFCTGSKSESELESELELELEALEGADCCRRGRKYEISESQMTSLTSLVH